MPGRNATIAESVKTVINAANAANGGNVIGAFTALRVYYPEHKPEDLADLKVTVYGEDDKQTIATRVNNEHEISIKVDVEKRLTPECDPATEAANAEIDPLMLIAETIADLFRFGDYGGGAWFKTQLLLPSIDDLIMHRAFSASIILTFKLLI